jgi:hypothetical protein
MRLSSVALAATLLLNTPAYPTDALAAIKLSRQRVQSADFRASGHLVRVDADGVRTSYAITLKAHWFPGALRVLLNIESPSDSRAHILLTMRPDGQNTIQIAHPGDSTLAALPQEKWSSGPLGAGFSYEDFLEPQYFWPSQTFIQQTKYGARNCDVVKSTPGAADRTRYAEVRTWLDHSIGFPVYAEKTLKGTGVIKEFTYFGLRHNGGIWSASQVEAKIRGHAGSTLLIIDRGSAKASLDLSEFSAEQLIHF